MRRALIIALLAAYINMLFGGFLSAAVDQMDDLQRSFKDLERSLKQDSLKDSQLQKDYQLPQQPALPAGQGLAPPPQQKIEPPAPVNIFQSSPGADRAVIKNQEILQEFINEQKRQAVAEAAGWIAKIPEKYRFMVELAVIALCITFFGVAFYKRQVKREEQKKVTVEDKGPDDGIIFYDIK